MTTPAAFTTALATRKGEAKYWLEIGGLPYAYGNFTGSGSWFASRPVDEQFLGVKPWMTREDGRLHVPEIATQEVDYVEGRCDMGSMRCVLTDVDDTLASLFAMRRTTNRLNLYSTLHPSDTTSVVIADELATKTIATAATFSAGANTLYLGRETIVCSAFDTVNTFTISQRGAYKSEIPGAHRGRDNADTLTQGAPAGEVVTAYPRSLDGRPVWLYLALDGDDATDGALVFHGIIRTVGWQNGARELVLSCDDWQGRLKAPLFESIGDPIEYLSLDHTDARFVSKHFVAVAPPGTMSLRNARISGVASGDIVFAAYTNDIIVAVEADGTPTTEPFAFKFRDYILTPQNVGVPTETSVAASEARGGVVRSPVIMVRGEEASGTFSGVPFNYPDTARAGHPLSILLSLLTSQYGVGDNGNYDTLPLGWGLGLDAALVDVAGIEKIRDATPGLRVSIPVLETVPDAREWFVKNLLQPFGFYFRPVFGSAIGVGYIHDPTPAERTAAAALTTDDLAVDDRGSFVALEGPFEVPEAVVGGLRVSDSPMLRDGKMELLPVFDIRWPEDEDTIREYLDVKVVEIETYAIHGGRDGFPTVIDRDKHYTSLLKSYSSRFGRAPVVIRAAFTLLHLAKNVGDLVALTFANLPDIYTGARGISGVYAEITQKKVDLEAGTVTFELTQSNVGAVATRGLAPACRIATGGTPWDNGTKTATVVQHEFSSAADDTAAFAVGDYVRVYSEDMSTRGSVTTIASKTATTIVLADNAAAMGITPAADYVILHADYGDQSGSVGTTVKGRFAFAANAATGYLGTASTPHDWSSR